MTTKNALPFFALLMIGCQLTDAPAPDSSIDTAVSEASNHVEGRRRSVPGHPNLGLQSTVSIEEAKAILEGHIERALAVLPDEAQLDDFADRNLPGESGPQGTRLVNHRYEIIGLDRERKSEYMDALKNWWTMTGQRRG